MPNKQDMLDKIYTIIKPTIFGNTDLLSGHTYYDIKFIMIGDILKYIANKYQEYSITMRGDGTVSFGEWQGKVLLTEPIENQSEEFIDFIYSLLPTKQD